MTTSGQSLLVKPVDPAMREAIERFLASGGKVTKLPAEKESKQ